LLALALAFWPTAVALVPPLASAPVPHWNEPAAGSVQKPAAIAVVARWPAASVVTTLIVPLCRERLVALVTPARV
jgi:hypothetical protein